MACGEMPTSICAGRRRLRSLKAAAQVGQRVVQTGVVDAEDLQVDAAAQAGLRGRRQADAAVGGVGDRGDAGGDALQRAQQGALMVFVRRERRLDVHQADDPVAELLVVQHAAEGGVLEVAVAVDEAGHDDRLAEVLDDGAGVGRPQIGGRAHLDDPLPLTSTAPPRSGGADTGSTQSAQNRDSRSSCGDVFGHASGERCRGRATRPLRQYRRAASGRANVPSLRRAAREARPGPRAGGARL